MLFRTSLLLALAVAACASPTTTENPLPPLECRSGGAVSAGDELLVDRSDAWGLPVDLTGNAFSVADINTDGFPDLIVLNPGAPSSANARVFLNDSGKAFVDFTADSGLFTDPLAAPSFASAGDADNDGDVDLLIGAWVDLNGDRVDQTSIFINDGAGHFTKSALPGQPEKPLTSAGFFFDQNNDGALDAFAAYWYMNPPGPFQSWFGDLPNLWIGDGRGGFVEKAGSLGIALGMSDASIINGTSLRPLFGASACDLDDDGRLDILGTAYGRMWNLLWHNGDEGFEEIGRASGFAGDHRTDFSSDHSYRCYCAQNAGECPGDVPAPEFSCGFTRGWYPGVTDQPFLLNGNTFSVACGDIDDDGDLDLHTGEIRHPDVGDVSDPSELLINNGDLTFARPGRATMGLEPPLGAFDDEGGQNNGLFDIDNDGRLDVYLGGSPYSHNKGWLFLQRDAGQFEVLTTFAHACPHGVALADFDRDGDEDLVVGTYGCNDPARDPDYSPPDVQPVRFYENTFDANNFISVKLVGSSANRSAIGARVVVNGKTREMHASWGRAALSRELVVHVGLAEQCEADIEVRWPDAQLIIERFDDVSANQRIEITQGRGIRRVP